ncbi:hypothetical protein VTJ49DRAFT_6629 [Mycothermus thermophilus]|uniref:Transmembrane protein n=1 Tax=Humicola insolens TaxID=85995 RepID=A0ABR3V260_HUMIN
MGYPLEPKQRFSSSMAKEWRSWVLRYPFLMHFASFNMSLMTVIITFAILSSRNNGFITIPDHGNPPSSSSNDNTNHDTTISIFLSTVSPPLCYNPSLDGGEPSPMPSQSGNPSARASLVGGGATRVLWTDEAYAFRPLSVAIAASGSNNVANASVMVAPGMYDLVANTTAHVAYVNCEVVTDAVTITREGQNLRVRGTDRGCDLEQRFAVTNSSGSYLHVSSKPDCSNTAHYSRPIFTAGRYDANSATLLAKVSVISCTTDFRVVTGRLEVSVVPSPVGTVAVVHGFTPRAAVGEDERSKAQPSWRLIETKMLEPVVFNPSMQQEISEFASVVLSVADQEGREDRLNPDVLIWAIGRVFGAVYAVATAMVSFTPLDQPERVTDAVVRMPVMRLFVVEWVSYVVLVLLSIALALTGAPERGPAAWFALRRPQPKFEPLHIRENGTRATTSLDPTSPDRQLFASLRSVRRGSAPTMVNVFEDPFAYDGSDFSPFLSHDQFASPPSPEEFHVVTSATEPNFPATIHHALKTPLHHPGYLSPTDPLGPAAPFNDASLRTAAHLPRSVPSGFQPGPGPRGLTIDTANLSWNPAALSTTTITSPIIASPTATTLPTTRPSSHPLYPATALNIPTTTATLTTSQTTTTTTTASAPTATTTTTSNSLTTGPTPDNPSDLAKLVTTLRNELSETRLQLSTVRNELYAARQIEKRLRVERDEARSHADG